jgi:hypothetical protein
MSGCSQFFVLKYFSATDFLLNEQYLSLSLKYTRLNDDQLRFFPRYLVNIDLSHCCSFTAHRLSKVLSHCNELQFLALNSCPAATALFCSEDLLGAACAGLQVQCLPLKVDSLFTVLS